MDNATTFRAFLGEKSRAFCLTPAMVIELERKTCSGIGGIILRVVARNFTMAEITETIRLALIGAGEDPQEAAAIVDVYVAQRPLMEGYSLALSILQTLMLGSQPSKTPRRKGKAHA